MIKRDQSLNEPSAEETHTQNLSQSENRGALSIKGLNMQVCKNTIDITL